jgi:hypothetical protein
VNDLKVSNYYSVFTDMFTFMAKAYNYTRSITDYGGRGFDE